MQPDGKGEQTTLCFYLSNFHFLRLVVYRQFILSTGILSENVDGIKVVLLEKEKAQREKGRKNSVTSEN